MYLLLLLVHHHLSRVEYTTKDEHQSVVESYDTRKSELLLQGWNSEVIVTTFIQFFNSIFGRYTSNLRRLHNISGSIIMLDEVQSIPVEYWDAVRQALKYLCDKFAIKITRTFFVQKFAYLWKTHTGAISYTFLQLIKDVVSKTKLANDQASVL